MPCLEWGRLISFPFELWVLVLVVSALLSVLWGTLKAGISPMPSSSKASAAMVKLVPESTKGPILELGSGWGGLALCLARLHPQAPVHGYELSTLPWLFSALRSRLSGVGNIWIHRADFRGVEMGDAAVVVCYLHPEGMKRLAETLGDRLAPGAVVISNTFALPGWKPERELILDDMHRTRVYRYTVADSHHPSPT